MDQLFVKGKIKSTFFVILMLSVSVLSGCVTDDATIIVGEDENNNGGNETANNTGNETVDTGNETANNTGNETANNTGNETTNNTGNETTNNTGDIPCEPNNDIDWNVTNLPDGSCCNSGGQCESMNCNYENWTCEPMPEMIDSDGDGFEDDYDAFPFDPNEWMDSDYDGVGDNSDAFPYDLNESSDLDGDGVGDNSDVFPNDPNESSDLDGDGVGDNSDAFPNDPNESSDSDGDGVGDNSDQDEDNDGWNNTDEIDCQTDPADPNSIPQDTDGDGICDPLDPVNNLMWANNSAHFLYVKPDTIENSNIENAKPYQIEFVANPMAQQNPVVLTQICDKGQGHVADVWSAFVLGPFPYDIISWHIYNTNGQSIGMFVSRDNLTQSSNMTFPTVISTQDTENQSSGHLEAEVIDSQYYTCEFDYTDTDGDGVLDWMDAFPNNASEWEDLDGDGIGNNADSDDDGDSCNDNMDWAPLNSSECFDTDGDGIGDNADLEPWINNTANGTFTMNYTMIGINTGHELYWLANDPQCPCYAYYYTTTPDLVWTTGNRSPVVSHENMPNVDFVLGLMGLTIDNLSVSSYPMDLGTDTQGIEWDYNANTGLEWRNLSSNLSILYVDDKPLFSINAYMMLYLDYYPMLSGNPPSMWGDSSFSPISNMLAANDALIYQHLFNAFYEDFGENNINYLFNTQDAIITNDFVFTINTPNTTPWLDSLILNSNSEVPGGLFDSVVSEVNVEQSQNGITMSKTIQTSENKMAVLSERIKEDEDPYFNE